MKNWNQYLYQKLIIVVFSLVTMLHVCIKIIGTVNNISVPNGDAGVNFMDPKGPSHFFKWPQREYICWISFVHTFGILNPLNGSQCGRNLFGNSKMVNVMSNVETLIQRFK